MQARDALAAAYAHCNRIAKQQAKNFYYGFLALPAAKRDAMCAMYAFMRRADDISDDESVPVGERREQLAAWLRSFRTMADEHAQDRLVFLAVRDVQQRYDIPASLLDELVAGTAMDLSAERPEGVELTACGDRTLDTYQTTAALERYCYLVASVVGLVTIRIFGYCDTRAEHFAVDLGKAFQYTNILRDVKEDFERGRVYLPAEVLLRHDAKLENVQRAATGGSLGEPLRGALRDMAAQAQHWYEAGPALVPLLDADSRPAMRTLIAIYQGLLREIEAAKYDVFSKRRRVSTARKLAILARGLLGRIVAR